MSYWRPLVQSGPRPAGALPLAGGPLWFVHAERLEREGSGGVVSAADLPGESRDTLTAPREPLAGLDLDAPRIMGILNATPDSFSDGGAALDPEAMAEDADILDIGGESTRPGATEVPAQVELARALPVLRRALRTGRVVSIDTRKASVARAALAEGAGIVNDVSAMGYDPEMASTIAASGAAVCLMHAQGTPETMQLAPAYDDVLLDVYDWLAQRVAAAEQEGIPRGRIVVDPGIGFGKTVAHNVALVRGLSLLHGLGCPVLLGASRKGFVGRIGEEPVARNRLPGSLAVALAGLAQGVQILRVHDTKETRQGLRLWQAVTGGSG